MNPARQRVAGRERWRANLNVWLTGNGTCSNVASEIRPKDWQLRLLVLKALSPLFCSNSGSVKVGDIRDPKRPEDISVAIALSAKLEIADDPCKFILNLLPNQPVHADMG